MYEKITGRYFVKGKNNEPSFSLTVAYRELARGHDCLLQKPVTLNSFLQKFWVEVLERMDYLKMAVDVENYHELDFIGAKLMVNDRPDNVVALHF